MRILITNGISFLTITFFLLSCAVPPKAEKDESMKPEITLQIASLNLGNFNHRIEKKDIDDLAKILKKEKIEVLAVQEISRYPGVSTRVDFVNELSERSELRSAFGEMTNISGRQTGNAVFSTYPIISYNNKRFDNFQPAQFESALEAMIDVGIRTITVVSTCLPAKSTTNEQMRCLKLLLESPSDKSNPFIITGNLPSSDIIKDDNSLNEVILTKSKKAAVPSVYYLKDISVRIITSRIVESELGKLIIVEFGFFK